MRGVQSKDHLTSALNAEAQGVNLFHVQRRLDVVLCESVRVLSPLGVRDAKGVAQVLVLQSEGRGKRQQAGRGGHHDAGLWDIKASGEFVIVKLSAEAAR